MVSPTRLSPRVQMAPDYQATPRQMRRPQHRFNLRVAPWQIQPMVVAPVLPGETLQSVMLQSQAWSDPLESGILRNIGWWNEYYLFYVKHRDLDGYERDGAAGTGLGSALIDMVVNNANLNAYKEAGRVAWSYTAPGGVDFVAKCVDRIVEEYFRDEGETSQDFKIGNVPIAKIYGRGQDDWSMRVTPESLYEDRRTDLDVDEDGKITVDEIDRAYSEWAAAYDAGLIEMDYEDWMKTYGVRNVLPSTDRVDYHRPELLFSHREFTYPTNTVEPTTGIPATGVGWRTAKQFRKSWLFPEPGWIIGITCKRPKMYLGRQVGSVAAMMTTRDAWLPAVSNQELDVSHLLIEEGKGPIGAVSTAAGEGYFIDLRDLMNNGDQFLNWEPADGLAPFLALPENSWQRRYATLAMANSYFKNGSGAFWEDGVMSLAIKGRQKPRYGNLVLGRA